MSLQQQRRDDLFEFANKVNVEVAEDANKKDILDALKEAGVTYEVYKKFMGEEEVKPAVSFEEKSQVLLKMDRQNGSFEAYGVTFTRQHPFAVVSEEKAQQIIDSYEGFRIATPAEAKSFYE